MTVPEQAVAGTLVERLRDRRAFGSMDGGVHWLQLAEPDQDCGDAADEIERLLSACKDKSELLRHAYAEVERLRLLVGVRQTEKRAPVQGYSGRHSVVDAPSRL